MPASDFWKSVRSFFAPPPLNAITPVLPPEDGPELEAQPSLDEPQWEAQSISGRTFVISYTDAKQQNSERTVLCRRLSDKAGTLYLDAYCFARERHRSFRADRIASLIDPETGELFEPGLALLELFTPNSTSNAPFRYGLTPQAFGDLNAAFNVLAFMARCDGHWHALEQDALLDFAASYWMRAEIPHPLDEKEITRHAARLAPDAEVFWVSLHRCAENPILRQILARHVATLIDADGHHHPNEIYWGQQVDNFLASAASGSQNQTEQKRTKRLETHIT